VTRTFVSFEADEQAFPTTGEPPGHELAARVSEALDATALAHDGPQEREGWAWEIQGGQSDVAILNDAP
jgi:hypothetical protein